MAQDGFIGQDGFKGGGSGTILAADTVATWDRTLVRYFLVGGTGASDFNLGYIDAVAGSTLVPTGLAKATIAGLLAILPRNGAGRDAMVLVANSSASGTTYSEAADFAGIHGYRLFIKRGSTDLTNSVADRISLGAMQGLVGPNGDGSWTATAGSTTTVTVASGLTAEANGGGITYMRIRWKGNVTAGLANTCSVIQKNSATVINFGSTQTAPAVGDEFFIERPGVIFTSFAEDACAGIWGKTGTTVGVMGGTYGFAVSGTGFGSFAIGRDGSAMYGFCESRGATTNTVLRTMVSSSNGSVMFHNTYRDEVPTSRSIGFGMRCVSGFFITPRSLVVSTAGFGSLTAQDPVTSANVTMSSPSPDIGGGLFFRGVRVFIGATTPPGFFQATDPKLGPGSAGAAARNIRCETRGMVIAGANAIVFGLEGENQLGDLLTIQQTGAGLTKQGGSFVLDQVVNGAAGGNAGFGINVANMIAGGQVVIGTTVACSASGTLGEIKLPGSAAAGVKETYAALALTNVVDKNKTNVMGTAGSIVGQCSLGTNKEGAALAVGEVIKSDGTSAQFDYAQADVEGNSRPVGITVTPPADNEEFYYVNAGEPYVLTTGAMTPGALAFLDPATAGRATNTAPTPAVDRRHPLGRFTKTLTGAARIAWQPSAESTLA